jgi:hypothetical protein
MIMKPSLNRWSIQSSHKALHVVLISNKLTKLHFQNISHCILDRKPWNVLLSRKSMTMKSKKPLNTLLVISLTSLNSLIRIGTFSLMQKLNFPFTKRRIMSSSEIIINKKNFVRSPIHQPLLWRQPLRN